MEGEKRGINKSESAGVGREDERRGFNMMK